MNQVALREKVRELRLKGNNREQISNLLSLPIAVIEHAMKDENGLDLTEQVVAARKRGLTYPQIKKLVGCSESYIYTALTVAGLVDQKPRGNRNAQLTDNQRRNIRLRYTAGEEVADIAKQYDVSQSYVRKLGRGARGGKRPRLRKETIREIKRRMNSEHITPAKLAAQLNIGRNTVYCHQFYDPMTEMDLIAEDRRWPFVKYAFRFTDTEHTVSQYQKAYLMRKESRPSYKEIAKKLNMDIQAVRNACRLSSECAYRAIWELRRKRDYQATLDAKETAE